ncbi:MAG: dihydroorotase [Flavobacteriales bacterium]|nr:dihydroorotase [Flavobacteriales bacterium]
MKDLLIKRAHVIDPAGPHHDQVVDVLVQEGRIARIGERIGKGEADVIEHEGLHLSPGWVDTGAAFRDPGEEHKEDVRSGLDAAASGGFTAVAVLPGTTPPIDGRSGVEYLLRKAEGHAVRLLPMGTVTAGGKGEQLAEMHDMAQAGAVLFTDDHLPIRNTRLMMLALQYTANIGATVAVVPQDRHLSANGQMHEGPMSTRLGLRGIPSVAEAVALHRDLALLDHTASRLHVALVSTAEGVELIRQAKSRKLNVTASVAAHHLLLDDGCLRGYDSVYKVWPPLRDQPHIDALREGVKDGTLDAVVSDHRPEDVEHKRVEFGQAAFGALGLETAFAVANTALRGHMSLRRIVERFTHGPRRVLGLPLVHVQEHTAADLTLFDPTWDWTFTEADIRSRSRNSPFLGQPLCGKALGIVAGGQLRWNA